MRSFFITFLTVLSTSSYADMSVGTIKLYDEPHKKVSSFCDLHREMTLGEDNFQKKYFAALENKLTGLCEIAPPRPNARKYKLSKRMGGCHEFIYSGQDMNGNGSIEITDNSSNYCEAVLPAVFIVEETDENGNTQTYYSEK